MQGAAKGAGARTVHRRNATTASSPKNPKTVSKTRQLDVLCKANYQQIVTVATVLRRGVDDTVETRFKSLALDLTY